MRGFRIAELARRTGTPKETIHYYLRIGLLRKPQKSSKNMAYYDEGHVEQLKLIRKLRTESYLPLSVIKKMIRDGEIAVSKTKIDLAGDLFSEKGHQRKKIELEHLDEATLTSQTGAKAERLEAYRQAGLLLPRHDGDNFVYGWEDLRIAEILMAAEKEAGESAGGFVIERFQLLEKHITNLVQEESAHFFTSLVSTSDPLRSMNLLQGGRDTIGRYLALARVRRLRFEIDKLLKEVESVLKKDRPDARPLQSKFPLAKQAKETQESLEEAAAAFPKDPQAWVVLFDFLLNHGLDTRTVEHFESLSRKLQEHPEIAILAAEALMEVRRHEDALSLLIPMRESSDSPVVGVDLIMSASILGRLRDGLLMSALSTENEDQSLSSGEVISDLVKGLFHLYEAKAVDVDGASFRHLRYLFVLGRIQLAMPAFLGRSDDGRQVIRDLLVRLSEFGGEHSTEHTRLEWNAVTALAIRSPSKKERAEMENRAGEIEEKRRSEL